MAILNILEFPDARLRTIAKPVDNIDESIRILVDDMLETMYSAQGIGLAATQVNISKRVVVMDLSEEGDQPMVLINPEVKVLDDLTCPHQEGCLSVPGFYETIQRPEHIHLTALDRDGNRFELLPDGLLAVCIQHEIDHLDGKLFVDYLSTIKRQRIRTKLEKLNRHPD